MARKHTQNCPKIEKVLFFVTYFAPARQPVVGINIGCKKHPPGALGALGGPWGALGGPWTLALGPGPGPGPWPWPWPGPGPGPVALLGT